MLEGKELLEKAKLLSRKSENEIAKGCGYIGPSGRILRKSFYRALIEAKGYKIGNGRQGKNGNRVLAFCRWNMGYFIYYLVSFIKTKFKKLNIFFINLYCHSSPF